MSILLGQYLNANRSASELIRRLFHKKSPSFTMRKHPGWGLRIPTIEIADSIDPLVRIPLKRRGLYVDTYIESTTVSSAGRLSGYPGQPPVAPAVRPAAG